MRCRRCRGSGIDPDLKSRYTTGGHNDRSCKACNGDGEVTKEDTVKKPCYKLYNEQTKKYVTYGEYRQMVLAKLGKIPDSIEAEIEDADITFDDPVEAHCTAYDVDDWFNVPINVVAFDNNGKIC